MRRSGLRVLVAALVLLLAIGGCSRERAAAPGNIVFISIDTLRGDHTSGTGHDRPTTPFLDSLAAGGTTFSVCRAPSSWTAPSMASLFTSVYSRQHGVRHGMARRGKMVGQEVLAESFLTIAEAFRAQGYRTFGISSNGHVTPEAGMDQGFDEFVSLGFTASGPVHEAALEMKDRLPGESPFFLWVHYYDPHAPYSIHKPWLDEHVPRTGFAEQLSHLTGKKLQREVRLCGANEKRLRTLEALYDGEIHYSDNFLRRLFEEVLPGLDATVVVTSDHGEHFLEHNLVDHGQSLYEEVIRVPLVIVPEISPKPGLVVDAPCSILDVYPTLLEMAGLPLPPGLTGESLVPVIEGGTADPDRVFYAELDRVAIFRDCIIVGDFKLIVDKDGRKKDELYDLSKDPGEQHNRLDFHPEVADSLRARLLAWREANPVFDAESEQLQLSPEQEEQLRSLGYVK